MGKIKYIKTKDKEIIMFGEIMQHSDFQHMNPVSAGFISIGINKDGNPDCTCYGKSISLGLDSHEDDTRLAKYQLGFIDY